MDNLIVTQPVAALAFGVSARTMAYWLKGWAAPAKLYDTSIAKGALVDAAKLYKLLCERDSRKWQSFDYQEAIANVHERTDAISTPNISSSAIAAKQDKSLQSQEKKELTEDNAIIASRVESPKNNEVTLETIAEMLRETVRDVKVEHSTLTKTTDLAQKKHAEISVYQKRIADLEKQLAEVPINTKKLETSRRKLNYYYITIIAIMLAAVGGLGWYVDKEWSIDRIESEGRATKIEQLIQDNTKEITRLENEKVAAIEVEKEKQLLLERATGAEKKQLQSELSKIALEKSQLTNDIKQLKERIDIAEYENLLLREQINQVKIDKSDGKDADPNGSNMDGQ